MPRTLEDLAVFAAPGVFVLLWASGFIGAKLGLAYAEPLTFLALRMGTVVVLLGAVMALTRPRWPSAREVGHSVVAGLLVHGLYLGGVFIAIENGLSAGMMALVVSLQPALTSTLANRWLGERVHFRQWFGLALGVLGVYLIVRDKATTGDASAFAWSASAVALLGITIGTLYQKAFRRRHRLAAGARAAICGGGIVVLVRCGDVGDPHGAVDAAICLRARLARVGAFVRRGVAVVFFDPPLRRDPGGQPVLSDAAGHRAVGLGVVR
jgi:drug/metabolite transporter (DMT)-like permease